MSEGANTSLFSNFTNKLKYKLHEATYDPKANEFAQQEMTLSTGSSARAETQNSF